MIGCKRSKGGPTTHSMQSSNSSSGAAAAAAALLLHPAIHTRQALQEWLCHVK
jgi:hypothetical protein